MKVFHTKDGLYRVMLSFASVESFRAKLSFFFLSSPYIPNSVVIPLNVLSIEYVECPLLPLNQALLLLKFSTL